MNCGVSCSTSIAHHHHNHFIIYFNHILQKRKSIIANRLNFSVTDLNRYVSLKMDLNFIYFVVIFKYLFDRNMVATLLLSTS